MEGVPHAEYWLLFLPEISYRVHMVSITHTYEIHTTCPQLVLSELLPTPIQLQNSICIVNAGYAHRPIETYGSSKKCTACQSPPPDGRSMQQTSTRQWSRLAGSKFEIKSAMTRSQYNGEFRFNVVVVSRCRPPARLTFNFRCRKFFS
eukprot:237749-Amphidinium_carterae.1